MTSRLIVLTLLGILLSACSKDNDNHAVGTLEWDRMELVAEASEPIVELVVREGDRVKQGDVILRLDTTRLQAQ